MSSLSNKQTLVGICTWQFWYGPIASSGKAYGLNMLKRGFEYADKTLHSDSRKTVIRMQQLPCYNCGASRPSNTEGDHLIPTALGGPDSIENFSPLCAKCNSSKGKKDLIDWWVNHQNKSGATLPLDVVVVYVRFMFQILEKQGKLNESAPGYYEKALVQVRDTMPAELREYFETTISKL